MEWNGIPKNIKYTNRAFYEVFIIINKKDASGITGSESFTTKNYLSTIFENDLILCETSSGKLITYYTHNKNLVFNEFIMNSKALEIPRDKKIIQISSHFLPSHSLVLSEQINRVFYVSQGAKKTIITTDKNSKKIDSISFVNFEVGPQPIITNKCENYVSNLFIPINSKMKKLSYFKTEKQYPGKIILKSDSSSNADTLNSCIKTDKDKNMILMIEKEKDRQERVFFWNFNSYEDVQNEVTKQNIVYFSNSNHKVINTDSYKDFAWPLTKSYVVFISISRESVDSQYISQVVFYKEDNRLHNILNDQSARVAFDGFPEKLIYNRESSGRRTTLVTNPFGEFDAVYLSETEVIYQIDIPNFQNCNPILKVEHNNSLRIFCKYCLFSCQVTRPTDSQTLTPGLKRITTQITFVPPLELNNIKPSAQNKPKRSRVLI